MVIKLRNIVPEISWAILCAGLAFASSFNVLDLQIWGLGSYGSIGSYRLFDSYFGSLASRETAKIDYSIQYMVNYAFACRFTGFKLLFIIKSCSLYSSLEGIVGIVAMATFISYC